MQAREGTRLALSPNHSPWPKTYNFLEQLIKGQLLLGHENVWMACTHEGRGNDVGLSHCLNVIIAKQILLLIKQIKEQQNWFRIRSDLDKELQGHKIKLP